MILFATPVRSWSRTTRTNTQGIPKEHRMQKTALLVLALSAGWAPAAFAFPPCPQFPVDLTPIDGPTRVEQGTPPWFSAVFALQGHPSILDQIAPPGSLGGDIIHSGKCRKTDRMPVLSDHAGRDAIDAIPVLAPDGGFGTVGLPDLRLSDPGMALVYTLSFSVDGAPLADIEDWFDLAELELRRADVIDGGSLDGNATLYRVRKGMRADGTAQLAVLESRRLQYIPPGEVVASRPGSPVVVTLPMGPGQTGLSLRWYQRTRPLLPMYSLPPVVPGPPRDELHAAAMTDGAERNAWVLSSTVDTVVELADAKGHVLYRRTLVDQWAASLSMGLINYNTWSFEKYVSIGGPVLDEMRLEARLDHLPASAGDATQRRR
jgi:hypothetical protein